MSFSGSTSIGAGSPALSVSARRETWRESLGTLAISLRLTMGNSHPVSRGSISAMEQTTRWLSRVSSRATRALS